MSIECCKKYDGFFEKLIMFKVSEFLEKAKQKKQNAFFICDAAQVNEKIEKYLKNLKTYENSVEVFSLFSGTQWGNAPLECSPLIFDFRLSKSSDEYVIIEDLLNTTETMHVLYTNLTITECIKQKSKFLNIKIDGEDGDYLFRWFDPRILKLSNTLFSKEQIEEFYKNIDSWEIFVRNLTSSFEIRKIKVGGV